MPFLRRVYLASSSVLLLQAMLLGAVSPCAQRHVGGRMGEATVASHQSVTSAMGASATEHERPCGDSEERSPADACNGPGFASSCSSMSACRWTQSIAVAPSIVSRTGESTINVTEPAMLRTGQVVAPELPPPRA